MAVIPEFLAAHHEGKETMLFPGDWLDAAMAPALWSKLGQQARRVEAIGVDVATGGRDLTCWTLADERGVIEQIVRNIDNTMEIAGFTIELLRRHDLSPQRVAFDAGGGGKPIVDRLREQDYDVYAINFGESADAKESYKNRRAELYGKLRNRLDPSREEDVFALPPDAHQLRRELAVLPYHYGSEGKLVLPPKDRRSGSAPAEVCVRSLLGGRSPDRADSLVLAVWVLDLWKSYPDYSDVVMAYVDDDPLTPEEIAAMPQEFRELFEMYDELEREFRDRQWDDFGW